MIGAIVMAYPIGVLVRKEFPLGELFYVLQESQVSYTIGHSDDLVPELNGEMLLNLVIAWAVSTLMSFLADSSRRKAFANEKIAQAVSATQVRQIEARILAEKELESAQALAEARSILAEKERASNEAKSEFISMLCHEIRTPLNGCLASAEMLLETELDSDQVELANTVRVSGSILLSTVSNFLDYFKLEAGKALDVVRTPLDVPSMVGDVHRIMQAMIGIGGEVNLLPPNISESPRTAIGDPSRLCGILLNMYMNAAKFTRRGSIGLKVHVVPCGYRPRPPGLEDRSGSLLANISDPNGEDSNREDGSRLASNSQDLSNHTAMEEIARELAIDSKNVSMHPEMHSERTNRSLKMLVQDEGEGWMSTCSQVANEETHLTSTSNDSSESMKWVSFEVHDTGCGVQPGSLKALFHDYVQGDEKEVSKPRTRSGTGLGLAICAKQVSFVDGVIGALSKPDVGSIFWFKVPMIIPKDDGKLKDAVPDLKVRNDMDTQFNHNSCRNTNVAKHEMPSVVSQSSLCTKLEHRWSATNLSEMENNTNDAGNFDGSIGSDCSSRISENDFSSEIPTLQTDRTNLKNNTSKRQIDRIDELTKPAPNKPLNGLHVLLAEDNLINRNVACRVLSSLGVTCHVAGNGSEAVDIVKNISVSADGRLDLILMDVCMPLMGGIEATKVIRELGTPLSSSIPIVAMTANAMDRDKAECLEAGMNDFLSKPVLREQLLECIRRVCL